MNMLCNIQGCSRISTYLAQLLSSRQGGHRLVPSAEELNMAIYLRFALTDFVFFKLTSLHGLLAGFPFGSDCSSCKVVDFPPTSSPVRLCFYSRFMMDSRTCLLLVFLLSQQLCVCAADQGSSPTAPSSLSSLSGEAVVNTVCTVSERTNEALVPSAGAKPYTNLLVYGDGRESVGKACCGACSTNVTGCGAYSVKIKRTANPTKKDKGMCRLYDHAAAATLSVKKCNSAAGQECASARVPDSHTSRTSSGKQRGNAYLR